MRNALKTFVRDRPVIRAAATRAIWAVRSLKYAAAGIYTLCYHHVSAAASDNFSRQIAFLKRHGDIISVDDAVARLQSGRVPARPAFVLTFDDGYADNIDVAMPVMQRHQVPAMLFIVTDWLHAPPVSQGRPDGYMTPADVTAWLDAGFCIGSHSASHRRFSRLADLEAADELATSERALNALACKPIRHFACPWGVVDEDYIRVRDPALAERTGYVSSE